MWLIFITHNKEENWCRTHAGSFDLSWPKLWKTFWKALGYVKAYTGISFFWMSFQSQAIWWKLSVPLLELVTILKISHFVWQKLLFFQLSDIICCLQHGSASVLINRHPLTFSCPILVAIICLQVPVFYSDILAISGVGCRKMRSTAVDFVDGFLIKLSVEL